jgi:hypothetical protein
MLSSLRLAVNYPMWAKQVGRKQIWTIKESSCPCLYVTLTPMNSGLAEQNGLIYFLGLCW